LQNTHLSNVDAVAGSLHVDVYPCIDDMY
jgi:hypothetical protein